MVSPNSMVFLAENGLDLNQWVLEGIPYSGGNREVTPIQKQDSLGEGLFCPQADIKRSSSSEHY